MMWSKMGNTGSFFTNVNNLVGFIICSKMNKWMNKWREYFLMKSNEYFILIFFFYPQVVQDLLIILILKMK